VEEEKEEFVKDVKAISCVLEKLGANKEDYRKKFSWAKPDKPKCRWSGSTYLQPEAHGGQCQVAARGAGKSV
jgi:hypothetical protein